MSINVTVKGNPISINRGKMVTTDAYNTKNEFEKRRLMRLEQVRQQSKEIAEDVRNKVRREKEKQISVIEKEGKAKLKNWQNRKLLELQNQYKEALSELGMGHKEAVQLADESDILKEQTESNQQIAEKRGTEATAKLRSSKIEKERQKHSKTHLHKAVRDIEKTRSSLVSNLRKTKSPFKKKKTRKKASADISITIPDSDTENEVPGLTNLTSDSDDKIFYKTAQENSNLTSECSCIESTKNEGLSSTLAKSSGACSSKEKSAPAAIRPSVSTDEEPSRPDQNSQFSTKKKPLINQKTQMPEEPSRPDQDSQFATKKKPLINQETQMPSTRPSRDLPLDTRISDRIKRRGLLASQPDYCDTVAQTTPVSLINSNTDIRDAINNRVIEPPEYEHPIYHRVCDLDALTIESEFRSRNGQSEDLSFPKRVPSHIRDHEDKDVQVNLAVSKESQRPKTPEYAQIPQKPPVKLKSVQDRSSVPKRSKTVKTGSDSSKVRFYDHPNRFHKEVKSTSVTHVERINDDSVEVIPDIVSEEELFRRMQQRDREAHIRGQRALEKERIHRDYQEMMKKLPALQKQERICEISNDKPEYHMSEERRKELERKRQNQLDNAYLRLFPQGEPTLITLPKKRPQGVSEPGPSRDIRGSPNVLNVGSWDVNKPAKMFTAEEVQEIVKAFTDHTPSQRRRKLKELLRSLKLQKEELLKEFYSLPQNDSISQLICDLNSVDETTERTPSKHKKREKSKRKRSPPKEYTSSSTESTVTVYDQEETSEKYDKQKDRKHGDDSRRKHGEARGQSPRKKVKVRSRAKIIILQNTSTQTTPKPTETREPSSRMFEDKCITTAPPEICRKLHTPCTCNELPTKDSSEDVCQILIKLNDDKPEVIVKPTEKNKKIEKLVPVKDCAVQQDQTDKAATEKPEDKREKSQEQPKRPPFKRIVSKLSDRKEKHPASREGSSRATSWREEFSKNSITSSTSYYSPPDFSNIHPSTIPSSTLTDHEKSSFYNLHKKPQQQNLHDFTSSSGSQSLQSAQDKLTDSRLLVYIKKLLAKSRASIDNLSVSSSSVPTPSQSVIEMESNRPMPRLDSLLKFFKLNLEDIEKELSYSSDRSQRDSSRASSERSQRQNVRFSTDVPQIMPEKEVGSSELIPQSSTSVETKEADVLMQYAEITDSCSKRIANLAAKIQQIREEKIQMLVSPSSDSHHSERSSPKPPDVSTAYLDLPDRSSKESSSLDEEELNRRMVEIDLSLANRLRKFSSLKNNEDREDEALLGATHDALLKRLQRLMENPEPQIPPPNSPRSPERQQPQEDNGFVPLISDIPKLPIFEIREDSGNDTESSKIKRPPPSKGLTVARKFNGDILQVPHELSTIVEADSVVSTKLDLVSPHISPKSKETATLDKAKPSEEKSRRVQIEDKSSCKSLEDSLKTGTSKKSLSSSDKSQSSNTSESSVKSDRSLPDVISEVPITIPIKTFYEKLPSQKGMSEPATVKTFYDKPSTQKEIMGENSSSSTNSIEALETMLRSIGMEWAIPTIHKTHEALALTSSNSSSSDLSAKKSSKTDLSTSNVSLKYFLKKQALSKISSSTLKLTDASPGSLLSDMSELSAIQVNTSGEQQRQKTSTPVTGSKSTNKTKDSNKSDKHMFTVESDISSVRDHSNNKKSVSFHSLLSDSTQSKTNDN